MKCCGKLRVIIGLLVWAMSSSLYAGPIGAQDPPSSIFLDRMTDLYEGVNFDHTMHVDMYSCGSCHHHTTGDSSQNDNCNACHSDSPAVVDVSCSGCHEHNTAAGLSLPAGRVNNVYHIDKPRLKGALHLQCLGCHQVEGGPTGCQECHAFTSEGRKRFAVKDSLRKK